MIRGDVLGLRLGCRRTGRPPPDRGARVASMLAIPPPKQNPTTPILPVQSGRLLSHAAAGDEILADLLLVELGEQLARLVLVARIAAERRQRVGREGHEALERDATSDVLDVRIQPAVLVHHQDAGELAGGRGGPDQVATHLPLAPGRRVLDHAGLEALVVLRDLLGLGEARAERIEEHRGGHAADGVLGRALEEAAAVDVAVHVLVEEVQEFLVEIGRGLAIHVGVLRGGAEHRQGHREEK